MVKILFSVLAIIFGALLVNLGNGMIGPDMVLNAFDSTTGFINIGAIPASYGIGFLVGTLTAQRIIYRFGHIRTFALFAAIITIMCLSIYIIPNSLFWVLCRGVMGLGVAVMQTCSDSWVGSATPKNNRGQIMAIYAISMKVAHFGAPALLGWLVAYGENPVLYATLLFCFSLIPVVMTQIPAPPTTPIANIAFKKLITDVPSAVIPLFSIGICNGAVLNLLPVYGKGQGLSATDALLLVTIAHIGGIVFQWPFGWLSDRIDRRKVIACALWISTLAAFLLVFLAFLPPIWLFIFMGLWGAGALSGFAICLSHAVDHYDVDQLVPVFASLLMCWASGAAIGPALSGFMMAIWGLSSLFIFTGGITLCTALFVIFRLYQTDRRQKRASFINVPVSGQALFRIDPRQDSPPVVPETPKKDSPRNNPQNRIDPHFEDD